MDGAKFLKRLDSFGASESIRQKVIEDTTDEYVISISAFSDKGEYLDLTSKVNGNGVLSSSLPEGKWVIEVVIGGFTNQW